MATARPYRARQAFFREFAVGPELTGIVRSIAEDAKVIAVELSQDFRIAGEYADSFEVDTEVIQWGREYPGPRVTGVLTNTATYAAAVEWGNEDVEVFRDRRTHRFVSREYAAAHPDTTESIQVSYPGHRVLGRTLERLSDVELGQ